jgi:hypothetical protein
MAGPAAPATRARDPRIFVGAQNFKRYLKDP